MTQGVLPFKYEESKKSRSLTSFSGLLPYVELLYQMDFFNLVKRHVQVHPGEQGWLDGQILLSLILLNLAGGDCPEDIERLKNDKGLCKAIKTSYKGTGAVFSNISPCYFPGFVLSITPGFIF
jgi:hypothetical protein